jgi:2-methylcitrate synthase/citrate synthase II
MTAPTEIYSPGLDGIIAGETAISCVEQDSLRYRGYAIDELAAHASFEEVAWLLLHGALPTATELDGLRRELDVHRALPVPVLAAVRALPREAAMMDVLRSGVSLLAHYGPADAPQRDAVRLLGAIPSLIAARLRMAGGGEPPPPRPGLGHAAQFLYLAGGQEPSELAARVLNLTLVLYAEHEFNASTFAARVCASTGSDLYSAVVAAIGTLKGPLHGGANEEAIRLITRFSTPEAARAEVAAALDRKEKLMGFGHRVYKHGDHRARLLEPFVRQLAEERGRGDLLAVYEAIRDVARERKGLHPNLDYPSALVYYLLDLPIAIYTPIFVMSRVAGWCAHIIEQAGNNRLIRPRSRYTGPAARAWVPLAERG